MTDAVHQMTDALPVIGRRRLSEQVADLLGDRILSGEWGPGWSVPPEAELGVQLGVSRSVIRDGMRTLEARGLVEIRQGVGTTVARPTDEAYADATLALLLRGPSTVGEVLAAREELEVMLAAAAAQHREAADCAALREHLAAFAAAAELPDWDVAEGPHVRFHDAILVAAHVPALEVLLRPLHEIVLTTSYGPVENQPGLWSVPLHTEIAEAIEAGDEAAARDRMRAHFAFRSDEHYAEYHAARFRDAPHLQELLRRRRSVRRTSPATTASPSARSEP